jgi:hypothetical protein
MNTSSNSVVGQWLTERFRPQRDPLLERLSNAKNAGTPLTTDEQNDLEAARDEIRRGEFTVDGQTKP